MNGLDFLNLVIGLIFIYLIYSIAASSIWEIIINAAHLRGNMLRNWIFENFSGLTEKDGKKSKIIEHPLISGMFKKSKRKKGKPTYISSGIFTDVLIDLVVNSEVKNNDEPITIVDINTLKNSLNKTPLLSQGLKSVFLQYVSEASGNLQQVKDKIGKWFDEAQERLIGSYKRNLQIWIFLISLILVGVTNADTIKLASYLYTNPDASEAIAYKASLFIQDSTIASIISNFDTTLIDSLAMLEQTKIVDKIDKNVNTIRELKEELDNLEIPIGWRTENFKSFKGGDIVKKIGGLLLTVFAVSLGAPFWFDILSKLANLRSSGEKPKSLLDKKPEK